MVTHQRAYSCLKQLGNSAMCSVATVQRGKANEGVMIVLHSLGMHLHACHNCNAEANSSLKAVAQQTDATLMTTAYQTTQQPKRQQTPTCSACDDTCTAGKILVQQKCGSSAQGSTLLGDINHHQHSGMDCCCFPTQCPYPHPRLAQADIPKQPCNRLTRQRPTTSHAPRMCWFLL